MFFVFASYYPYHGQVYYLPKILEFPLGDIIGKCGKIWTIPADYNQIENYQN